MGHRGAPANSGNVRGARAGPATSLRSHIPHAGGGLVGCEPSPAGGSRMIPRSADRRAGTRVVVVQATHASHTHSVVRNPPALLAAGSAEPEPAGVRHPSNRAIHTRLDSPATSYNP